MSTQSTKQYISAQERILDTKELKQWMVGV